VRRPRRAGSCPPPTPPTQRCRCRRAC
jgi:hypothetical protein